MQSVKPETEGMTESKSGTVDGLRLSETVPEQEGALKIFSIDVGEVVIVFGKLVVVDIVILLIEAA